MCVGWTSSDWESAMKVDESPEQRQLRHLMAELQDLLSEAITVLEHRINNMKDAGQSAVATVLLDEFKLWKRTGKGTVPEVDVRLHCLRILGAIR